MFFPQVGGGKNQRSHIQNRAYNPARGVTLNHKRLRVSAEPWLCKRSPF